MVPENPSDLETNSQLTRIPQGIEQEASSLELTFLQGRGQLLDRGELRDIDPRIEEGEISTVDFIINYRRYVKAGVHLRKGW